MGLGPFAPAPHIDVPEDRDSHNAEDDQYRYPPCSRCSRHSVGSEGERAVDCNGNERHDERSDVKTPRQLEQLSVLGQRNPTRTPETRELGQKICDEHHDIRHRCNSEKSHRYGGRSVASHQRPRMLDGRGGQLDATGISLVSTSAIAAPNPAPKLPVTFVPWLFAVTHNPKNPAEKQAPQDTPFVEPRDPSSVALQK